MQVCVGVLSDVGLLMCWCGKNGLLRLVKTQGN